MDDQEAILCLQRGDINGLETLVRRYQLRAVRSAYLITHDHALAEDIVQSVFIRAYERSGQLDLSRPFGPWFLRSVVNDALKAVTRTQRLVSLEPLSEATQATLERVLADPAADLADAAERTETHQLVRQALHALSPAQRVAVVQRYYLDMSEAEMAHSMQRPVGTIKSRLAAARQRLRILLHTLNPEHADDTPPPQAPPTNTDYSFQEQAHD
ncbi:MAG: sigma-70 family RNA polymerase sigma factor [Chloroflexota bacterium]|nr:sigma-70 family RNA polymerase sigma factor [Chloroflexota bacterium]